MSNNSKYYKCTLKPTDIYFFGQDDRFSKDETAPYYLISKNKPSQLALLGIARYLVLLKNKQLVGDEGSSTERRNELIGTYKPMHNENSQLENDSPFGVIKSISPLFIEKEVKIEENGECKIVPKLLIKTPYNHLIFDRKTSEKNKTYTPMEMIKIHSEYGLNSLVSSNYNAKDFLSDSYMDDNGNIYPESDIFGKKELTRIARKRDANGKLAIKDGAFFKKKYSFMKKDCAFVFYIETKDEKELLPESGVVYMGQEKSSFTFNIEEPKEYKEAKDCYKGVLNKMAVDGYKAYYALSDFYIDEKDNKIKDKIAYSIVCHSNSKFISDNRNSKGYKDDGNQKRVVESKLYNFVNSGSVYYVKNDADEDFKELLNSYKNLDNTGLNYFIEVEKK